jgi:hypothetical protein
MRNENRLHTRPDFTPCLPVPTSPTSNGIPFAGWATLGTVYFMCCTAYASKRPRIIFW